MHIIVLSCNPTGVTVFSAVDWTAFSEAVIVPIVVALITASTGIVAVLKSNSKMRKEAEKFRVENNSSHEENNTMLKHLSNQVSGMDTKIDRLDERIDDMALWQAEHEKRHMVDQNKKNP